MKSITRVILSLFLTVIFLVFFLRSFDLTAAWASIRGASSTLLVLAVLVNLAAYPVRAWRWRQLLSPMKEKIGFYNLTSTTLIGFMISFLVPMRIGEVVRPVLLARRERIPASGAIATIALERLFDAMTVMGLYLVFAVSAHGRAILAPPVDGAARSSAAVYMRLGATTASLLVAAGLPLLIVLVVYPKPFVAWLHRLNRGGPDTTFGRGIALLEQFLHGLKSVRRLRELTLIIASSLAMWLMIDLSVWLGLRAFDVPLGFFDTFLIMVALTVGISVPTPGGVGPYEYFCQISLTDFWGVPAAVAGAVAVTLHAIAILPPIVIGLLLMWKDGVRPAEVKDLAHVPDAAEPAGGGTL